MSNICLMDVLEEEKGEYKKKEVILEEIMTRDFPKMMKDINSDLKAQ